MSFEGKSPRLVGRIFLEQFKIWSVTRSSIFAGSSRCTYLLSDMEEKLPLLGKLKKGGQVRKNANADRLSSRVAVQS